MWRYMKESKTMTERRRTIPFWVCLAVSVVLAVAGFCVPPTGIVDGSVLTCIGLLLAFATLAQIPVVIQVAGSMKLTAGGVTLEASKDKKPSNTISNE